MVIEVAALTLIPLKGVAFSSSFPIAPVLDHPQPNQPVRFVDDTVPLQLAVTTALIMVINLWITFILLSQQWSTRPRSAYWIGVVPKFRSICTHLQQCFTIAFLWALYWEWSSHRWEWGLPTYHACWVYCLEYTSKVLSLLQIYWSVLLSLNQFYRFHN